MEPAQLQALHAESYSWQYFFNHRKELARLKNEKAMIPMMKRGIKREP